MSRTAHNGWASRASGGCVGLSRRADRGELGGPLTNAGLSISKGLLRHIEALRLPGDPATRYRLFNHALVAGTDGIQPRADGGGLTGALPCEAAVACTRTVDGNGYRTTYLTAVQTGAPCIAAELQATGRYVYWSCGANGPAGVYDQTRKVSVTGPGRTVAAGRRLSGAPRLRQR